MKAILSALLAFLFYLPLMGADKKPLTKEESAKVIEAAIRKAAKKPTGELTKADLEKLTKLNLSGNQLTDVKFLEKLTQLQILHLEDNPDLTKAQIDRLQEALPNCGIYSDHPLTKAESAKVVEAAIRKAAKKPTGELTEVDLEKVTSLYLSYNRLTDVTDLEKLTQLKALYLDNNHLTKAQIAELQKALPKCKISHNAKK